jgi:biopolymer transport protein ExbD
MMPPGGQPPQGGPPYGGQPPYPGQYPGQPQPQQQQYPGQPQQQQYPGQPQQQQYPGQPQQQQYPGQPQQQQHPGQPQQQQQYPVQAQQQPPAQAPGAPARAPGGYTPPPAAPVVKYKAELRKTIRKKAEEPEINFLNITAMLDIMTIILVFLLKNLGESSASIPQSDDLRLPNSAIKSQPNQEGVVVTVSKTQILVGDNKVLVLPGRDSMAMTGAGERHKRKGPNDLYIVPLGNALGDARKTDKIIRQAKGLDPAGSEAIVVADGTTPYRLLIEVLYTLGQNEFTKYHLMVMQAKTSP